MSSVRALKLSRGLWYLAQYFKGVTTLDVGDQVRVCKLLSPHAGRTGRVAEVVSTDVYGPYLVRFDDGLRFRYQRHELTALTNHSDSEIEHC